jgi:hypothetical protein
MKMKTILILDDEDTFRRHHIDKLSKIPSLAKHFVPKEVTPAQFESVLNTLENRRAQARKAKLDAFSDACIFDDADILVVDYDLLSLTSAGVITGENVAYLARCFSRCGLILGLNQFGANAFDLTLKGHPESFADLNIGSEQLENLGLWAEPWKGFRSWAWPLIPQAVENLERRVKQLHGSMEEPILPWLQLPEVIVRLLPRVVTEFITKSKPPATTTFAQFVTESGNGLRGQRDQTSEECKSRIAAARVSKWLERLVLSGQDMLVDAPHLVSRFPSLLKGNGKTPAAFNRTAAIRPPEELGIDHKKISAHRFAKTDWLSRPAWYWPNISALDKIEEVQKPWETKHTDLAFCEDTSRFIAKKDCHEFVADLPSQFARRFVARVDGIDYRPEVRLSL